MTSSRYISFASLCLAIGTTFAQQSPTTTSTLTSQPGRAAAAEVVKASVVVAAIDSSTRTLTLKGEDGKTFDIVGGPEVRNFDRIKIGDHVVVQYHRALTLKLQKDAGAVQQGTTSAIVRAEKGAKPGAAAGELVTVVADVIDVNEKGRTISLRGPKGNVVVLDVQNPDQFKVVKKGDHVRVDYAEALAVSVEPAPVK